ncbi:outer membrane protein [Salmonella enterica subsp. arizonae]|uniref:Outer membrane protein n=1 Tax=Salmonella enterica subsp. arizonae TaxID=59203 RepID=A0A2X4SXP7_SALER|nr:outer membrane protein [Salmonella enterica subsp. arizonae]
MKKRVFVIAAIVSGALAVSGCTTNPYTGEREAGKSGIGAVSDRWSAQVSARSPPLKKIAVKAR